MDQNITLKLCDERAWKWYHKENAHVKGYGWLDGILYEKEEFASLVSHISTEDKLCNFLEQFNGSFAGCLELTGKLCVFVDHVGSIPMFYDMMLGIVGDRADFIDEAPYTVDEVAVAEVLKSTMFACGERTFSKTTKQLLAGEIVCIAKETRKVKYIRYYSHRSFGSNKKACYKEYLDEIREVNDRVFRRLIESLHGETVIVPLSGGYDSRFIVSMLRSLNYKNVVCYTYGYSDNTNETGISRKVADKLGYPHFLVKIDKKMWQRFFNDAEVQSFLEYGYYHSNFPHIQEIMALQQLRKNPEFPQKGVVLPGFCGDIFGGSYTISVPQREENRYDKDKLVEYIFRENFFASLWLNKYDTMIKGDIASFLDRLEYRVTDITLFDSANMEWFIAHKIAHFIHPCVKSFEYYGYSWRLPLWDKELEKYWMNVPIEYKQKNSLYDYSLMNLYFQPLGIAFQKNKTKRNRYVDGEQKKWLHNMLHDIAYGMIMRIYYHTGCMLYFKKDSNNFYYLCKLGYKELKNKKSIHFSSIRMFETLVDWWLEKKLGEETIRMISRNSM